MKKSTFKAIMNYIENTARPCPNESESQQRAFGYVNADDLRHFLREQFMWELEK